MVKLPSIHGDRINLQIHLRMQTSPSQTMCITSSCDVTTCLACAGFAGRCCTSTFTCTFPITKPSLHGSGVAHTHTAAQLVSHKNWRTYDLCSSQWIYIIVACCLREYKEQPCVRHPCGFVKACSKWDTQAYVFMGLLVKSCEIKMRQGYPAHLASKNQVPHNAGATLSRTIFPGWLRHLQLFRRRVLIHCGSACAWLHGCCGGSSRSALAWKSTLTETRDLSELLFPKFPKSPDTER